MEGRGSWSFFSRLASSDFSSHLPTRLLGLGSKIQVAGLATAERTGDPSLPGAAMLVALHSWFVLPSRPWPLSGTSTS